MQVQLTLKTWKVVQDTETKLPKVAGVYGLMMGEKEIATQAFNEGYSEKKIPFSHELLLELQALEAKIKSELEKILA